MQYLKSDTNTEVLIGPAVAVGDGFTPVTTLSLSTADEAEIIKYGGATPLTVTSISANGFAAITGADGYYTLDISTANSDTEGFLTVLINDDSLILPIRVDFMVVNANVYDSLFAAATTDYLQTDVAQWLGTAAATPTTAGVPEVDVTFVSGTAQTANDNGADINTLLTRIVGTLAAGTHNPATAAQIAVLSDWIDAGRLDVILDAVKAKTDQFVFTVANQVDANAIAISGDTVAADNLELQYDTTGLIGDTFPATQAQVGSLSVGTAAISITAESFTKSGAEPETLTYTATHALDGTVHLVEDVAGAIDCYYQFDIGTEGVPVEFRWDGYCNVKDDVFAVYAYNYSTPAYEQLGTIVSVNGTTVSTEAFPTTINHVGTGANLGKVRFRIATASGAAVGTDRVLCSYAVVPISGQTKGSVVDVTPAANNFDTDLTEPDGHWDDALVKFTSGTLINQTRPIAGYLNANGNLTFNSGTDVFTAAPVNGDTFIIVHDHVHPVAQIANAVVTDAVIAELTTQGDTNETKLDTLTTNVATVDTVVDGIQTDLSNATDGLGAIKTDTAAILVDTGTTLPALIDDLAVKKNTAFSNFSFLMVLTSDHVTPATGLTVTGQRSIDGGAFASVSGTIAEVSNGIYQFDALAADTNGDFITWRFSSATADDQFFSFKTVA